MVNGDSTFQMNPTTPPVPVCRCRGSEPLKLLRCAEHAEAGTLAQSEAFSKVSGSEDGAADGIGEWRRHSASVVVAS